MKQGDPELRGTGRRTRLWIATRVGLNLLLALALAIGFTWLADRPGLHHRFDLTSAGANTLHQRTNELIERLPAPVEIDVFFRPERQPLTAVVGEAQQRMFDVLLLAAEKRPDLITLNNHDLLAATGADSSVVARMEELDINTINVVVLSVGERRTVLPVLGVIADIEIGFPSQDQREAREPRLAAFRGEEAFVEGLLKITQTEKPLVLFGYGHGEPDLYGEGQHEFEDLRRALESDGFHVQRWDSENDGGISKDCALLALLAPDQPLTPQELEQVQHFVASGGRLITALGSVAAEEAGSLRQLNSRYGVAVDEGIVCRPIMDSADGSLTVGTAEGGQLRISSDYMSSRHPITQPLHKGGRAVRIGYAAALERSEVPPGAVQTQLLTTPGEWTWLDKATDGSVGNWTPDEDERSGPFVLALSTRFPPTEAEIGRIEGVQRERPESRVVALASPTLLSNGLFGTNRDFALNLFNWCASREFRVNISARDPELRIMAIGEDRSLFHVHLVCSIGLPLFCLLFGVIVAFKRRSHR